MSTQNNNLPNISMRSRIIIAIILASSALAIVIITACHSYTKVNPTVLNMRTVKITFEQNNGLVNTDPLTGETTTKKTSIITLTDPDQDFTTSIEYKAEPIIQDGISCVNITFENYRQFEELDEQVTLELVNETTANSTISAINQYLISKESLTVFAKSPIVTPMIIIAVLLVIFAVWYITPMLTLSGLEQLRQESKQQPASTLK